MLTKCYIVNNTINSIDKVLFVGSMKLTVVIVTLILMTLVDEGATWGSWRAPRWRAPRVRLPPILRKICNPICTTHCVAATECPLCAPVCSYGCDKSVCTWIGRKRSEPQVINTPSYIYENLTIFILLKLLFIRRVCLINKRPQFIS